MIMKTPQLPAPALATALGVPEIYLKREDQHHFWSHKGRSIPHMIDEYRRQGVKHFVISSSGNAALAAVLAIQTHNQNSGKEPLSLSVFVGQKITDEKLRTLKAVIEDPLVSLSLVERPKQMAMQMEKKGTAKHLRQSTDDLALEGYRELAMELDHIPNLAAIFIPTSSGTTAQALGMYFKELAHRPQIHIVQTTSCHPIADACGTNILVAAKRLPPPARLAGAPAKRASRPQDHSGL